MLTTRRYTDGKNRHVFNVKIALSEEEITTLLVRELKTYGVIHLPSHSSKSILNKVVEVLKYHAREAIFADFARDEFPTPHEWDEAKRLARILFRE